MPRMRVTVALLFVATIAAAEPDDRAPAPSDLNAAFSFTWRAPDGCPSKSEVLARAERLVGHALTRASAGSPVELVATVQLQSDATWQLEVRSGPGGENRRVVTAGSCDELGDAMALWLALSTDPDYATRGAPGPAHEGEAYDARAAHEPAVSPRPESPVRATYPPAPTQGREFHADAPEMSRWQLAAPWRVSGGAAGAVWLGRLPGTAPGGAVHGALSRGEWSVGLELGLFPAERAVQHSVSADLSLATLAGTFGYALFDDVLTPYAGLELDLLHGVGRQVDRPASGNVWLLGFDAGLRVSYRVHRSLRLFVDGRGSVLAEQARFHVEPSTELFRPSRVGAQFGLGAELRLR